MNVTRRPRPPGRPEQRGAASVELVIIVPVLVVMLGLLVAGGRLWFARATVVEASQAAARAGSLARSAGEARSAGGGAASRVLATDGLRCDGRPCRWTPRPSAYPSGNPATVAASVGCRRPGGRRTCPRACSSGTETPRARRGKLFR